MLDPRKLTIAQLKLKFIDAVRLRRWIAVDYLAAELKRLQFTFLPLIPRHHHDHRTGFGVLAIMATWWIARVRQTRRIH